MFSIIHFFANIKTQNEIRGILWFKFYLRRIDVSLNFNSIQIEMFFHIKFMLEKVRIDFTKFITCYWCCISIVIESNLNRLANIHA